MRIPKNYGQRTQYFKERQTEQKKYILVYEGEKTEVKYFQGIIDNRVELNINPIIDLIPVLRSSLNLRDSHPKRILRLLVEHIEDYNTVKVFKDKFIDYCCENLSISEQSSFSIKMLDYEIEEYFSKNQRLIDDKIDINHEIISNVCDYLSNNLNLTEQVEKILEYINEQQIVYDKELDTICIIIDRDKGNVKKDQYDKIVEKCNKKGFNLYVTNPTFEFWLLLHSDKIFEYDKEELLLNTKVGKKRYLERVLSEVFKGYKKEKLDFEKFKPYIQNAVINEKKFCESIELLKEELGSNVGLLIEEILDFKRRN